MVVWSTENSPASADESTKKSQSDRLGSGAMPRSLYALSLAKNETSPCAPSSLSTVLLNAKSMMEASWVEKEGVLCV